MKSTCPIKASRWVHKLALVLMLVTFCLSTARITEAVETLRSINVSEFGEVTFFGPQQVVPRGFAFLFSGEDGLNAHDEEAIDRLVESGLLVAAINSRIALKTMEAFGGKQECLDLIRPLQRVSRGAQADWKFSQYQQPVLLGRGVGAALVYVALAQAWPYVFAGGMSVDVTPAIKLNRTLCGVTAAIFTAGQRLSPQLRLRSGWQLGSTGPLSAEASAFAHDAMRANGADTVHIVMPKTLTALYNDAIESFLRQKTLEAGQPNALASLPIIEVSNDTAENTLVIVYSGDAGWRALESGLADVLKDEGYAVLGIDGSRYFWLEQTPERVAQDLARMMKYYRDKWRIDRVVLAGYAFGANLLPFAYNRLPAELQNSVSLIVFVSPNRVAQFGLGGFGWLSNKRDPVRWSLEPEMRQLDAQRIQCIYGKAEASDSLCTAPVISKAEIIERFAIDPHNLNAGEDLAEFIISRIEQGRQKNSQ